MRNVARLGWTIAAAFVGILAATGFQNGFDKVGSVDINSLIETSDQGKTSLAALESMKKSREDLLKFIDDNRVLTMDQANKLRALWLKDGATSADTANLESLKADINAAAKNNIALGQKPNLTPEERTLLQDYATRSANMEQLTGQWFQEFSREIQDSADTKRRDTLLKARTATQSVAKANGYSLVFDSSVAVYAANDLTSDALKAMNAAK